MSIDDNHSESSANAQNLDAERSNLEHDRELEVEASRKRRKTGVSRGSSRAGGSSIPGDPGRRGPQIGHSSEEEPFANDTDSSHPRSQMDSESCAMAGVIESVSLVDFMCHENLSIDLGPNMNFVIGHNGSGKSAILTAITVCLGGKAASSGRGSSLKNFVRNGQSQALVVIKLKNRGPDAYNHALYGDSIIIERKFGAEGGGGYIIKGADRQIHGRRREDLDAITDHFGLAIENPMNILSQDTARQFLANATPRTLYDLFMKGIELQQLEADHQLLSEHISSTTATIAARGRSLEKLKEQEEEAAKIYAETHRAREAQDEFDVLKDKMAWVQVRDAEVYRDEVNTKVTHQDRNLQTLQASLDENAAQSASLRAEIAEVDRQMADMCSAERGPIQTRADEQKRIFEAGRFELQKLQTDQRECHSHIKRQEKTIEELKKAIEKETAAIAENEAGLQRQRLIEQKSELDEKVGTLRDELADMEAQYSDTGIDISEKKRDLQTASAETENAERLLNSCHERLNGLRKATTNKLSAYHNNMEKLLSTIQDYQKRKSWRECPVGPLGTTMILRYPEWSDIVETFWGGRINGFLVTCHEDKQLLLRIMSDMGVRGCPVLQGKTSSFVVDEPEDRFLTVLRAIEWSDERVMRQLIITNHPENALLIKERKEAELTMDPLNPPKNANRAFAIDPDDPSRGFMIGGGARGSSMQQTVNAYRHPKRLTRSSSADVEQCQSAVHAAQEKVRSSKEIERLLEAKIRSLEQKRLAINNRRSESHKLQQRYAKQLDKIKDDLETSQAVDDGKLQGLNESLGSSIAQKESYEAQYRAILTEKGNIDTEQKIQKKILLNIQEELSAFEERLRGLEPRLTDLTTLLQEKNIQKTHFERQLEERIAKKETYMVNLEEAEARVLEYTTMASAICPRVELLPNDSVKRLQRLLEDKQKAIQSIRLRYGGATEAEIAERLAVARENLLVASTEVNDLQELVEELRVALNDRQDSRKRFQKFICLRAKQNFVRYLAERDFTGKLSFKHDVKELHTYVTPADVQANMKGSGKARKVSDNKVLSGGEKSFTTICLLLSIWEAMGCPIRALDEFDVFMDSVNRGISMKMMIDSANAAIDKQFIVITPQDMGGVKPTLTTKIHKLADPVRGVSGVTT